MSRLRRTHSHNLVLKRGPVQLRQVLPAFGVILLCVAPTLQAQNSGIDLHASSHAGAAEIGLPTYPGATLYTDENNNSGANLGLSFGDFHFSLLVVQYKTKDSPDKVLAFYRKPLSRYGEVLECNHGKAVGDRTTRRSGLTCSDDTEQLKTNASDSSESHELRAGAPHKFRIVSIDQPRDGATRFGLVYLELPKDSDSNSKTD